jgi:hypothetical protein
MSLAANSSKNYMLTTTFFNALHCDQSYDAYLDTKPFFKMEKNIETDYL